MSDVFSLDSLLTLLYMGFFFLFFAYGQRIQSTIMLIDVRRKLGRLERMRRESRERLLGSILRYNTNRSRDRVYVEGRVDRVINSFAITPVGLDPSGIVSKLEHVLDTYDENLKAEVRTLAVGGEESEVNTLTNLLEVSIGLDTMYRMVRHYYLLARKQGGMFALAQLQMSLPSIMEEAEAYRAGIEAFAEGKTVGDGVGPLVASRFASGSEGREVVKDTILYDVMWEGRRLLIVRAKGPGGNVGKPGLAVEKLIQGFSPIALVITIDAALKLEGETSGEVAEGVGAAIGGPGTERYHIEEAAVEHGIPMFAVVLKMSSKEAISKITPEINAALEKLHNRVQQMVLTQTKAGDSVIVAGIGNTLGIS